MDADKRRWEDQRVPVPKQKRLLSIQFFTHPEITHWSIFKRINNRFFLTYLASVSSMVHTDNSLFIPADEDAQRSSDPLV
ncbi:hypothetical protein EK904_013958 [Melospiza melodia maxima]|nr:hypothetical protein EK904_013958 [Melospiza melodia maxima]